MKNESTNKSVITLFPFKPEVHVRKMDFLDAPRSHMPERSPSQTAFVIEEDGASEYGDAGENPAEVNSSTVSKSRFSYLRAWAPGIIIALWILCISLAVALAVVSSMYSKTFPPYEICRTKACEETAALLIKSIDDRIDPCEDFHLFSCGSWIEDTSSVVEQSTYDHTTIMRNRILGRLRSLTEAISTNDIPALHQLKSMYDSCVDLESIEKAGLKPLVRLVKSLVQTNASMATTLGRIRRKTGQSYLINLKVDGDYVNNSYNTIFLDQPELPLDKGAWTSSNDDSATYEYLIKSVATIVSKEFSQTYPIYQRMVDNVKQIVEWDTVLSNAMTDAQNLPKPKMNNLMTLKELNRLFSGEDMFGSDNASHVSPQRLSFNWTEYFDIVFEGFMTIDENTTFIANDMAYLNALATFLKSLKRDDFDLYITWQIVYTMGMDVTSDFRLLFDRFTGKMDGNEASVNRHTACIAILDDQLPFLLTHKYMLKYVEHSIIDETEEMAQNIINAFKVMVTNLDWMDEATKRKAMEKADHVRKFVGYPAWLRNTTSVQKYYEGLKFTNSFFRNMVTLMEWTSLRDLRKVGQPVDLSWSDDSDSPAEADAFYLDELNSITLPVGFLQEPFIGMGISAADYGALGAVIGHELTHGFDTEGRYSDAYGRLSSWWSVDTLTKFVGKTQCFIDQYNSYRLPELESILGENNTVNGRQTLAENIADNGGIREALRAYRFYAAKKLEEDVRLPGLEKYTSEQIFFLAFAQSWCAYMNPTSLANLIQTNEHSPSRFRILGPLSNFDDFSEVWKCNKGSGMNPVNKCVLW